MAPQRCPSPRVPRPLSSPGADPVRGGSCPSPPCRHPPGQHREAPGAWWSPWKRPPPSPRPGERRSGRGPRLGAAPAASGRAGATRPGTVGAAAAGRALRLPEVGAGARSRRRGEGGLAGPQPGGRTSRGAFRGGSGEVKGSAGCFCGSRGSGAPF